MAYALDNLGAITQNFANDAKYSTGWKGGLQNLVRMVAPQFRLNDLVKSGTYQTIDQAASFNQMTQRSIVEVIPGYLSRILHETRMIRTGDHSISSETYDITRGQFREERTAQDNLAKRIVGMGARRSVKWSLNNTVDAFDSKGKLSPEAKHALEERLLRDAMEGKHFDPAAYIRPEGYAPGTDPAVLSKCLPSIASRSRRTSSACLASGESLPLLSNASTVLLSDHLTERRAPIPTIRLARLS
jgi:hypothetical protein